MIKYFYSPFPRPKNNKSNFIKVFLFGVMVSLFIVIFKPFNIENDALWYYNLITFVLGLIFSSAIYFMEFVIPILFKSLFKRWTLGKAILWYTWLVLFVSAVMFLLKSFIAGFNDFTLLEYLNVIGRITALSLIVAFFALGIISYFNRKKIALLSSKEVYTITAAKVQPIELNLDEVLYIVSDDNYVDIHLESDGERSKLVFRSSLKNIEDQIVNPISPIYRCHRRYLININRFEVKSRKSRKASIVLQNYDDEVPVSSRYERSILEVM